MTKWKIVSAEGLDMGIYEADSPEAALDAMARDAGCENLVASARELGAEVESIDDLRDAEDVDGGWTTDVCRFRGGRINLLVEEIED